MGERSRNVKAVADKFLCFYQGLLHGFYQALLHAPLLPLFAPCLVTGTGRMNKDEIMRARLAKVESQIEPAVSITTDVDFALELAELKLVLSLAQEDGQSYENRLQSALLSTDNEWLFSFPAERFPIKTKNAAAVRIYAGTECKIYYVLQGDIDDDFQIVDEDQIDAEYIQFADSFAEVATALGPLISRYKASNLH